jgi:sialic acid synthase SpsE
LSGPDHKASLEPDELTDLVQGVRRAEAALGDGIKRPAVSEANTRDIARKSLVAARNLTAGTVLRSEHIARKRPATGLKPALLPLLEGRSLARDISADELFTLDHLV